MTPNTNTTSGAADRAIENCPELNMGNYDEVDVERLNDWAIRANDEIDRLHALAAGQATAAQAVAQDDLITIRKPTTSAELLWLLKLAHLVISDVDKTLEETFSPAQPAAEASRFGSPELQAMIIVRCVEKDQADSGFDYKTAADFLSGKTVSDEALRKFVAASRGAHDARAALHAKMLSLQGELASREAEIALLKRSLLDAEADAAAPQPRAAPATQQPEGGVVAYLDVGVGGYLDLGSELSEDALQQLPKGRHALVIAGTYGIDGYVAAPQPSHMAQAVAEPLTPDQIAEIADAARKQGATK